MADGKRRRRIIPKSERLAGPRWMSLRLAGEADWQSFIDGETTALGKLAVRCVLLNEKQEKRRAQHEEREKRRAQP